MKTLSQLTKDIKLPTYLGKFTDNSEIATKHFISTHEEYSPQNAPFFIVRNSRDGVVTSSSLMKSVHPKIPHFYSLTSLMHSNVCECTCENTLHIIVIIHNVEFLDMLNTHIYRNSHILIIHTSNKYFI